MTARLPLVLGSTGLPQQLQSGDTLPLATTGAFGVVKPDGSTITVSAGVISSVGGGGSTSAITFTALKALSIPANNTTAIVDDDGRSGFFVFSTADHSSDVTRDPGFGITVPPNADTTGASGAWIRQYQGPVRLSWWGVVADGVVDDPWSQQPITTVVTGAQSSGGPNLIQLIVASTLGMTTNDLCTIVGVTGTGGFTLNNGSYLITVVSSTLLNVQGTSFAGTANPGGSVSDLATAGPHIAGGTDNAIPLLNWQIWAAYYSSLPALVVGAASGTAGVIRLTIDSLITTVAMFDGDIVDVTETIGTGGFSANGSWVIHVVDSTHIELLGTTYAGSWVSGGIVQDTKGGHDVHVMCDNGVVLYNSIFATVAQQAAFTGTQGAFRGAASSNASGTSLLWTGILNLTLECDNGVCAFQNMLNIANAAWSGVGQPFAFPSRGGFISPTGLLINQTEPLDTFITLVTPSDASNIRVGQWILITSLDLQWGGFPPNNQYYEYHKVSAISGGTIFVEGLVQFQHRTDYPDPDDGGGLRSGKARIWPQNPYWGGKFIMKNIQGNGMVGWVVNPGLPNSNYAFVGGMYCETVNWIGLAFSESNAKTIVHYNPILQTFGEIDKQVETITYINGKNQTFPFSIQSSCPRLLTFEGGDYLGLTGLGQMTVANGTKFDFINPLCQYGYSAGGVFNGCEITNTLFSGSILDGTLQPGYIAQSNVLGSAAGTAGVVKLLVVSTATFLTGDTVIVTGVTGTTEANGVWSVVVVDSTHIELIGTVWVNAWVSGGLVEDTAQVYVTGAAASGGGGSVVRLAVTTTKAMVTGDHVTVYGISGTTEANNTVANPFWTITVHDATHIDLTGPAGGAIFANAWTSGGIVQDFTLISVSNAIQSPASPPQIRLTLSSTARLQTGNYVNISGIPYPTSSWEADGVHKITVIDGTHIDLIGTTFATAYAGGGVVQPNNSKSSYAFGVFALNKNGMNDGIFHGGQPYANLALIWSAWIPGQTFYLDGFNVHGWSVTNYNGFGIVRRITEDDVNVYIYTDLPFATLPAWANGQAGTFHLESQVHNFRTGQIVFNNCWGCGQVRRASRAPAKGVAYYEYLEYVFANASASMAVDPPGGELIEVEVDVIKPAGSTVSLGFITADASSSTLAEDGSGILFTIDTTVAGKRIFNQVAFVIPAGAGDTVTLNGSSRTTIPPKRIASGAMQWNSSSPFANNYQSATLVVKFTSDGGLARKGATFRDNGAGGNLIVITGPIP